MDLCSGNKLDVGYLFGVSHLNGKLDNNDLASFMSINQVVLSATVVSKHIVCVI